MSIIQVIAKIIVDAEVKFLHFYFAIFFASVRQNVLGIKAKHFSILFFAV